MYLLNKSIIRILQEQTEKALINHQYRLSHTENQLGTAESRLSMADTGRDHIYQELTDLRAEISVQKAQNVSLEAAKDQLMVSRFLKGEFTLDFYFFFAL